MGVWKPGRAGLRRDSVAQAVLLLDLLVHEPGGSLARR